MWVLACAILLIPASQDDEDAIKKKQTEIVTFLKKAKTERELRVALNDLDRLAKRAEEINEYSLAAKLYKEAERVARVGLKEPPLAASLSGSSKKATDIGRQFKRAERAFFRVRDGKGSPADHLSVGKFICFVKGGWEVGLKSLAEGSDKKLKKLAEEDLYGGDTPEAQVALGDEWASYSRKEPAAKERAIHWYSKVWPTLTGVSREKVRSSLQSIQTRKGRPPKEAGFGMKGVVFLDQTRSHGGAQSLLLRFVTPKTRGFFPLPGVKPLGPGKYTMSAWMLTDGTTDASTRLVVGVKTPNAPPKYVNLGTTVDQPWWKEVSVEFDIPDGSTGGFYIHVLHQAGNVWIDDLSIKRDDGMDLVNDGSFED